MVARLVQDRALLEEKRSQQAARSHRHLPNNKNRHIAVYSHIPHPGRRDHRSRVSTGQLHLIPAGEPWGWVLREAHPTPLGGSAEHKMGLQPAVAHAASGISRAIAGRWCHRHAQHGGEASAHWEG